MSIDFLILGFVFLGSYVFISILIQEFRPESILLGGFLTFVFILADITFSLCYIIKPEVFEIKNTELVKFNRARDLIYIDYIDEYGLTDSLSGIDLTEFKNIHINRGKKATISLKLYYLSYKFSPVNIEESSIYITLPEHIKIPNLNDKKDQFSFYKDIDFDFKNVNNYNCYSNVKLQNNTYIFSDKLNNVKFEYKSNPSINIQHDSSLKNKVCLEIDIYQNESGIIYERDNLNNRQILRIPSDFDDYNLYIRKEG